MKKILIILLILSISSICSAGRVQQAHKAVIAAKNGAASPPAAGTVSYVSSSSVAHGEGVTTLNVASPTGGGDGDLLIASCCTDIDQAITDFDGFSLIDDHTISTSRLSVAQLVDAGAASYDFAVASADGLSCAISRFSKTSGTWTIVGAASAGVTVDPVTVPSVTVTTDNSILYVAHGNDDASGLNAAPADMTQAYIYTADDPQLIAWYQAVDAGTISDKTVKAGGDKSVVVFSIEAQ
jgi:hypothetical protein